VIPSSVTRIGDEAFYGCTRLTGMTIPNGVISIGSWAFWNSGLTNVTITASVTEIGEGAFEDCDGLTLSVTEGSSPNNTRRKTGFHMNA